MILPPEEEIGAVFQGWEYEDGVIKCPPRGLSVLGAPIEGGYCRNPKVRGRHEPEAVVIGRFGRAFSRLDL